MMLMKPGALAETGALPDKKAIAAMMTYNQDLKKAGVLLAVEGLQDTSKGVRISKVNGRRSVIDGPFAESKELVGGFWLIQVKSKQEAVEWASRCPIENDQTVELRLVFEMADFPAELIPPGITATSFSQKR